MEKRSEREKHCYIVRTDFAASVFRQEVWCEGAIERRSERHSQLNETEPTEYQAASALPAGSQGLLYQLWVTLNFKTRLSKNLPCKNSVSY